MDRKEKQHDQSVGLQPLVFPESEQGASTKRHCSPASLELTVALEWNPEFILKAEPGYEQCRTSAMEIMDNVWQDATTSAGI